MIRGIFCLTIAIMLLCAHGIIVSADVGRGTRDERLLGSFLRTKHSVLPNELQHCVASFAAPQQDGHYPIDFVMGATIIPEWCGKVYDVYRDCNTGDIKILTCRAERSYMSTFKNTSVATLITSGVSTLGLLYAQEHLQHRSSWSDHAINTSTLVCLTTFASLARDAWSACMGGQRHLPRWEILIVNVNRMAIESRCVISDHELPLNIYFLENFRAFEVQLWEPYGRKYLTFFRNAQTGVYALGQRAVDELSRKIQRCNEWAFHGRKHGVHGYWKNIMGLGLSAQAFDDNAVLAYWLDRHIIHSPAEIEYAEEREVSRRHSQGAARSNQQGIRLRYENNCMQLEQFVVDEIRGLHVTQKMMLPSCIDRGTYGFMKTKESDVALLCMRERMVCVDLTPMQLSHQLRILLKNIIDTGYVTTGIKRKCMRSAQKGFSLDLLPELRRSQVVNNLRTFCHVKNSWRKQS